MFALTPKRLFKTLSCNIRLGYLATHFGRSSFSSCKVKTVSENEDCRNSFTVSYLIGSCGLSLGDAIIASRKIQLQTRDRPDSVLTLLKDQGFSSTHISNLVKKLPVLLLANPEKSLFPKIDFLRSIGVSGKDITRILSSDPTLFTRSLVNYIIPCYNFMKSIVETDEKVAKSFRRSSVIFRYTAQKHLVPNLALLRELGMSQSSISLLVSQFPNIAFMPHKKLVEIVEELKRMGCNPQKSTFVRAIKVYYVLGKETIEQKFETYVKWGWSEDEALMAFRVQPDCMVLSDERIQRTMDFLVNKMGWSSKLIAKGPALLCYSLEMRIIPRCYVVEVLLSRNLAKETMSIHTFMTPNEVNFRKRYVTRFLGTIPQLMDVYEGKIDPSALGNWSCSTETQNQGPS